MAELTHMQLWPAETERLCGLYLHLSVRLPSLLSLCPSVRFD
jgi:hypothetical protein